MRISPIILFLLSFNAHASFPEFFGAGVQNAALGNQLSFDYTNPSHNFYVPASLAWNKKNVALEANVTHVASEFEPITNIVVKNSTNTSPASTSYGNVNTDYGTHQHSGINATVPVKTYGVFGLSVFTPVGSIMETNSGDAFLPEYVLYRSRYKRTQAFFNFAFDWNDNLALSIGAQIGFQAGANVNTNAALNGTGYGSSATAKTQVDPSLAGIFSLFYRMEDSHMYMTFQQQMKSNLESAATGYTANPPVPFDVTISSMIYFDPHIFRFGYGKNLGKLQLLGSVEYQIWDSYETPIVRVIKNGGTLQGSDNYERVQPRNILVERIGLRFEANDNLGLNAGFVYRPSIFEQDYSGAGNSLDLATMIISGGVDYKFDLMNIPTQFNVGGQIHMLQEEKVAKSTNEEDGTSGLKIGAPGYTAGGTVSVITSGIKVEF